MCNYKILDMNYLIKGVTLYIDLICYMYVCLFKIKSLGHDTISFGDF